MWTRAELKTKAKAVLKITYWKAFLVSLLITIVGGNTNFNFPSFNWNFGGRDIHHSPDYAGGFGGDFFPLFLGIFIFVGLLIFLFVLAYRFFIGYPVEVGGRRFFIQAADHQANLNHLGYGFEKGNYLDIVKALLWRALINFLWYLLLIIPGIVKSYAYRFVPYILADNPNIGYKRALELSKDITDGQKWRIFVLDLSFIGWFLLGTIALFVGVLFVLPYYNATYAELYVVLRKNAIESGLTNHEELRLNPLS